ncbi:MAG: DUF2911 domain-containing protein [Gemmatimonadaceae bacterium]
MKFRTSLLFLPLAIGCAPADTTPEHYAFVALLGRDTVSVERVAHSRRRLVSDIVDRFPFVRLRHTEFDLTDDGRLRKMVMDIRTPNGKTPAERGRQVSAEFTNDGVKVSIRDSAGVHDTSFTAKNAIIVPHVSMMYSVIELEVAAALRRAAATGVKAGDSVQFRQFYPDRNIGRTFALHEGFVHPRDSGRVELRHDWLSGTGDLTVDSTGRLLTYSGARTTYQVSVRRSTDTPDIAAIGSRFAAAEASAGPNQLSVRDTARATIGSTSFSIDYGRPLARGRVLLGNVIPFDYVWRTGANAATQFTTSTPITLAGLKLPAGMYTLWTIPRLTGIELVVNTQTGQWGTGYDKSKDLGRAPLKIEALKDTVEKFTMAVEPKDVQHGMLSLSWGTFRWTAPIVTSPSR